MGLLAGLLVWLLGLLQWALLLHVVLSWVQVRPDNPVVRALNVVCEPLLAPIRRLLPTAGGLDFSPLVALVLLQLLRGLVASGL